MISMGIGIIRWLKERFEQTKDWALRFFLRASFSGDGLTSFGKTAGFRKEDRFLRAFNPEAKTALEKSRSWRLHTLCWAAERALELEGDFVECGVYRGFFSKVVMNYVDFSRLSRTFWLYDTFQGFSDKYTKMGDFGRGHLFYLVAQQEYSRLGLIEFVRDRFHKIPGARIIQGALPESLALGAPEKIAYLHVDLNSPEAEFRTLEALFARVVDGGVIIFDDYGWQNFVKQKEAIDNFMQGVGHPVLELPTGQGLVIKRVKQ